MCVCVCVCVCVFVLSVCVCVCVCVLCACVCVCVVCVSVCTPHGGLSDTSVLEIRSGRQSGLNSLPVRIRTLRSAGLRYAPSIHTSAEHAVDFYPTVKAALHH